MENKIRIGIIGIGHLGKMHLKNIKELESELGYIELSGAFDTDADKLKEASDRFNVKTYSTLQEIINEIDAALIITPTSTHFEIAAELIKNDKNIFIEKPVTSSPEEATKLKKILNEKNLTVQVGHIERFNPALLAVEKHELKPLFIESHRLSTYNPRGSDVSVIQDLMIHDIDLILSLIKSEVEDIDASGVALISNSIDIANARIKFRNGSVANITASRISQKKMRKMRIFQKNAYISLDFQENIAEVFKLTETSKTSFFNFRKIKIPDTDMSILYEKPEIKEKNPMKTEQRRFFESIKNSTPPTVTLDDGIRALKVAEEIIKKSNDSLTKILNQ
ncbi:MAG: Gfo/Idh/MocA family oxidoreductase [Ignavibacteria bacterium]|nr:Gfo/Idh/MocA family oxidoreductase [Ignavibacteria bacterium]